MSHLLLADARNVRLHAVHAHREPFALRRVMFSDRDAEVRAAAARRLGGVVGTDESWLCEALGDPSSLVRDGALRALARCGTATSAEPVRALIHTDRMWWVRRSAIYALAAIAPTEVAALTDALGDPFWRVRHAAVRVLAVIGARDPQLRDELVGGDDATRAYLRSSWGPISSDAPERARSTTTLLPPSLRDPDPAVVTARLVDADVTPLALVELLCDPHETLRDLAVRRLVASGDRAALIASLDWLEEHRIPHVADTVEAMLDGLGDRAVAIATYALAHPERRGALAWAIDWIAATRYADLYDAAVARAEADPSLRPHALGLADTATLLRWFAPAHADAIAVELYQRHAFDALDTLAGSPKLRALQVDAHARRDHWDLVTHGLADPHHGPRAIATRWLVKTGRLAGADDLDPAVREAALTTVTAFDEDPFVARAQADLLTDPRLAYDHVDPYIRAAACRLPIADLSRVLQLWADRDEMVRAAAADALAHTTTAELEALLATDTPSLTRTMAQAWLHRALDADAARTAALVEPDARARALLSAIAGEATAAAEQPPFVHTVQPRLRVPQRRLAGTLIAPLAISGVSELPAADYAHARAHGADTFFWEPAYSQLARYLRTDRTARVITGSYHADAASIEADVDRALRRLRRDTLELFLLFWSRSPARVDEVAFAMMAKLRASGKVRAVGFSTHHRDLAREAIAAAPWDAVMVRHSAAHPGIETELLPHVGDTAIVTFSALCYGRMVAGASAPSAAACYRYALAQPGVTACLSAPRTRAELDENLTALTAAPLTADELAGLRAHGVGVRAENHRFNTLMRQPTRDAAAAARELLATERPPSSAHVPSRDRRRLT